MASGLRAMTAIAVLGSAGLLGGCASVVNGSSQNMTLVTEPVPASCMLRREGAVIAAVNPTPGTVSIKKSRKPIDVAYTKDEYLEARDSVASTTTGWTAGNILFGLIGGPIGFAVDSSTGATNYYPESVRVVLAPVAPPATTSPLATRRPAEPTLPRSSPSSAPTLNERGEPISRLLTTPTS